jgi:methyl-accepting chemotaxis protein
MNAGMSIARKLILGFAFGPLILAIVGAIVYLNTEALIQARGWYTHTVQVLHQTDALRVRLLNAETGERGYVLTGDESYLAPYKVGGPSDQAISALAALTADNPRQQARLETVRALTRARFDQIDETIRARREKGLDAALDVIKANNGKKTMEDLRAVLDQMDQEENELLKVREADADRATQLTFDSVIYGTLISIIVLAVTGFVLTRSITVPLRNAIDALAASASEIVAGTTQQASGIQEQAASVAETVSTVDEITQTSEQANERAKAVADSARRSVEVGTAGRRAVESTVSVMGTVRDQTESIADSILGLAEQAQAIGEIITAVNEIAEQTHLLALNAAIEASRAGEHGRGFNVVAAEIRTLADQSKKATSQVRHILGEIQKSTNKAVMATEEGTKSVGEAVRAVQEAGETIRSLSETISETAQAAAQITASVGQQAVGMAQIQQAMRNINDVTNQNLSSTRQAEAAARDMSSLGVKLKQLLAGAAA